MRSGEHEYCDPHDILRRLCPTCRTEEDRLVERIASLSAQVEQQQTRIALLEGALKDAQKHVGALRADLALPDSTFEVFSDFLDQLEATPRCCRKGAIADD